MESKEQSEKKFELLKAELHYLPNDEKRIVKISFQLPKEENRKNKTLFIAVADKSGSMSGSPWKQVQAALIDIVGKSYSSENVSAKVIVYNDKAETLQMNEHNFTSVINNTSATGMTSFQSAFEEVQRLMSEYSPKGKSEKNVVDDVVIIFMTDGNDTSSVGVDPAMKSLNEFISKSGHTATIHTLGFTSGHNFNLLDKLRKIGTIEGAFRYAEPNDGLEALQRKFSEVFDFVSSSFGKVNTKLVLPEGLIFLDASGTVTTSKLVEVQLSRDGIGDISEWIVAKSVKEQILIELTIESENSNIKLEIPLVLFTPNSEVEKILFKLDSTDRIVDEIIEDVVKTCSDSSEKGKLLEEKWSSQLTSCQDFLSKSSFFGMKINKLERIQVLELKAEIQQKLDNLHHLLAEYKRGTNSVATIARANDIRFTGKFQKKRFQRILDQRAAKNAEEVKNSESELKNLKMDLEKLKKIGDESLGFYTCNLSQLNIFEILEDSNCYDEVMGFGLALQRPEYAVDDPTQLKIEVISNTIATQSSILEAIKYKINVEDQMNAHGGFDTWELGVALRGKGREPINSFLPLYIHEEHWKRVKIQLKSILGYFCTLDALGYSEKQLDVLFMTLGTMIATLSSDPGEHQLRLLFSFQRTCYQVAVDFNLFPKIRETVSNFFTKVGSRAKDQLPSLLVLVGYLAVLPENPFDEEKKPETFWLYFLEECIRRSCGTIFRESNDSVVAGIVDMILHGDIETKEEVMEDDEAIKMFKSGSKSSDKVDSLGEVKFDATRGLIMPEVEPLKASQQLKSDKKMIKLAKAELGLLSQSEQAKLKKEKLNKNGMKEEEKKEEIEIQRVELSDYTKLTLSALNCMLRIQAQVTSRGYPTLLSIHKFIKFTDTWQKIKDSVSDKSQVFNIIDLGNGIAPDTWVSSVKRSFGVNDIANPSVIDLLWQLNITPTVKVLKTLFMQSVIYHSNKKFRDAAETGKYANLLDLSSVDKALATCESDLTEQRQAAVEAMKLRIEWMDINMKALQTKEILAFVGYMLKMYSVGDRNEGFRMLCETIQNSKSANIPLLSEKMKVLLTGTYEGKAVIGKGNPWIPENENRKKFIEVMGLEEYSKVEILIRGTFHLHIYRASDIPNRHGHCNSNPYIPPQWQAQWLAMQQKK